MGFRQGPQGAHAYATRSTTSPGRPPRLALDPAEQRERFRNFVIVHEFHHNARRTIDALRRDYRGGRGGTGRGPRSSIGCARCFVPAALPHRALLSERQARRSLPPVAPLGPHPFQARNQAACVAEVRDWRIYA